ncbi:MAG TPA: hypothetical protein VMT00_14660 [Thermoanaerobaculia bacterium]|nr:hypothetical protein [Thermoanaerobaculia bacterium]
MQRFRRKRSDGASGRILSAILTCLPGAWLHPSNKELISLYRFRYRMALEEQKYDAALIFLDKILEVAPLDLEAKLAKAELYHRHLADYGRAVEHYTRVLKLSSGSEHVHVRARSSLTELMELLS